MDDVTRSREGDAANKRSWEVYDLVRKFFLIIEGQDYGSIEEPLRKPRRIVISAFVLTIDGRLIMFTAGHVVERLKLAQSQGAQYREWRINDGSAGKAYLQIPFDLELEKWWVQDDREAGIDLAFRALHPLIARNLKAGGVLPPDDRWWLGGEPQQCTPWFLFGVPEETVSGNISSLAMIPVQPLTSLPDEARVHHTRLGDRLVYAQRIPILPAPGCAPVEDPAGMSGGPVIGYREPTEPGKWNATLHLIGIQSGYLDRDKILTIFPLQGVLEEIEAALKRE